MKRLLFFILGIALVSSGQFADLHSGTHTSHAVTGRHLGPLLLLQSSGPTVPPEWAGVWEFDEVTYNCDTGAQTGTDFYVDTLCTGDPIVLESDTSFSCSGTVTESSFDVTCSASFAELPGCTLNIDVRTYGTRSGDSSEFTTIYTATWSGCSFPASCDSIVTVGTRISPEPASCATPVEPTSWGKLKNTYR